MTSPLRILHLEDEPNDARLVQSTLKDGGIACTTTCVQDEEGFVDALERGDIDLILSDFSLPTFDGLSALKIARANKPDLPVIFVSGTLGEEMAIDSLKSGATDYVLKGGLVRLAPAVRRAMQDVADRAERKRLEAQFIEGQKMDVIGQLAGGIAHDFNNILAVIMGYSELMTADLAMKNPLRNYAEEIWLASKRAAALTGQLLVFSRKQTVQAVVLDLNDIVKEMEPLLRRLIDASIDMKIVPGKQIGRIQADSGYVGQVLMNLAVNARDAMPTGGILSIATSNVTLDSTDALTGATAGDYVMLSVSDTGTGMSEEIKDHLFEAFFTTKAPGKGTGLGLATCRTIIQQSGGYLGVYSEVGHGATFKIYFPRVDQPVELATKPVTEPLPRGSETILLVEDDLSVMHLARGILESQGYEVLSALNGEEGLREIHERKGKPIRLVVTDVIMPLMGGKVMVSWIKSDFPDLKILFTSGYSDDAIANHGILENGVEFLPKPYSRTTLVRKVRELLDKGSASSQVQEKGTHRGDPAAT